MERKVKYFLFLIPIIYIITLSKDLYGGDSPELISAAYFLSSAHPPGYPVFLLLFRAFMFIPLNPALSANLFNMILSFVCLFFFYKIVKEELENITVAVCGTLILAFSLNFWYQSMYAETYILNLLFILISYHIAILSEKNEKWLFLLFFVAGLGAGNHNLFILLFPGIILRILIRVKPKLRNYPLYITAFLFSFLSIYMILPARAVHDLPINWGDPYNLKELISHFSRKQYEGLIVGGRYTVFDKILFFLHFLKRLFLQYYVFVIAGIYAIVVSLKKYRHYIDKYYIIIANTLILTFLIPIRFNPKEGMIFSVYYLPAFTFFLIFILHILKTQKIFIYSGLLLVPILIGINFSKCDLSGRHIFRMYNESLLQSLPKNSVLITDGDDMTFPVLYLRYVENIRNDITVYDAAGNIFEDIFEYRQYMIGETLERKVRVYSDLVEKYGTVFAGNILLGDKYDMLDKKQYFLTDMIYGDRIDVNSDHWDDYLHSNIKTLKNDRRYDTLMLRYYLFRLYKFSDMTILDIVNNLDKYYPEIYGDISYYFLSGNDLDKALFYLQRAYEFAPYSNDIVINYTKVLLDAGREKEVIKIINKALKDIGENYYFLYTKGVAYFNIAKRDYERFGRYDMTDMILSKRSFEQALRYNRYDHRNITNLALTLIQLGEENTALIYLYEALRLSPENDSIKNIIINIEKIRKND